MLFLKGKEEKIAKTANMIVYVMKPFNSNLEYTEKLQIFDLNCFCVFTMEPLITDSCIAKVAVEKVHEQI